MGTVICPNCGKETVNDEKCAYCNYPLRKKDNPYDVRQYCYLKEEYLKTNNKAAAIKSGMRRYGISMQEAKEIVDFIADEIYEEHNIRSKEQVVELLTEGEVESEETAEKRERYNAGMSRFHKAARIIFPMLSVVFGILIVKTALACETSTLPMICCAVFLISITGTWYAIAPKKLKKKDYYTFSFPAYFTHVLLYQIIGEILLAGAILFCRDHKITVEYPLVIFVWVILELVFAIHIFVKLQKCSTIFFSTNPGYYTYGYDMPALEPAGRRGRHRHWRTNAIYEISLITKVEERLNSFVIYGTITKTGKLLNGMRQTVGKKGVAHIEKVRIPKCFRDNKLLIETLKKKQRPS